jgi:hypothetical protein
MIIGYLPWNQPAAAVDRICMRDDRVELTYVNVATRVDALAEQFAAMGVGRGDVVAVMLPNRVELLLGLMAAWRLGAAATPINPVFTANEAGYQLQDRRRTARPDRGHHPPDHRGVIAAWHEHHRERPHRLPPGGGRPGGHGGDVGGRAAMGQAARMVVAASNSACEAAQ